MVNLLRALLVALAGLCLAAALTWFVADRRATGWVREALATHGLRELIEIDAVRVPAPDRVRVEGAALRDPATGQIVAQVDELELSLEFAVEGGWDGRPVSVVGRGGRVMLSRDGDELGLARAIGALVDRWEASRGPAATPFPPTLVHDVSFVVLEPGESNATLAGCTVQIEAPPGAGCDVLVTTGAGGSVALRFAEGGGLLSVRADNLEVSPTFAVFLPPDERAAVARLRPSGRLDLRVEDDGAGALAAAGTLRAGRLAPPHLPFPLERAELPFRVEGGRFRLDEARLDFPGGEARTSFEQGPAGWSASIDIVDAEFRAAWLDAFPWSSDLDWLDCEDGGRLELHLALEAPPGAAAPGLRGWGGLHVARLRLGGPQGVQVQDLVGSFDVRDDEVLVREASGACASGLLRVRGRLDAATGAWDLDASVFDVDTSEVRVLFGARRDERPMGWLQGTLRHRGRVGDPAAGRGEGRFSIRGGDIWNLPLVDAVMAALGRSRDAASTDHRAEVLFRVHGERWDLDDVRLRSAMLALRGSGAILADGGVSIDLLPISLRAGPLGELLEFIEEQLIRIEVRGTRDAPVVQIVPMRIVTGPLGSFWDTLRGLFSRDAAAR